MSNFDPLDTQAQERAKASKAARDKLVRDQEADDLKWLMRNRQGLSLIHI